MLLDGKVAIVTGAGRGIGRAVARTLAAEGAAVVVNDYGVTPDGRAPSAAPANEAVEEIRAAGGRAVAHTGSVAVADDVKSLIDAAVGAFGRLDILVNNAAIMIRNLLADVPDDDWDRQIGVHLRGTFLTCKAAAPLMMQQRSGRIINFTSLSGLAALPGSNAYTTAKAAILGLTRMLAQELAFYGVTVNAVAPGAATRLFDVDSPPGVERVRLAYGISIGTSQSSRRTATGEPVGAAVAYLASDEADYVNGQVIGVSGDRIDLWSAPQIVASAFSEAPWTVQAMRERFRATIGPGLSNPKVELP
jgi:NAD(P)-dependent dehydrogenase (short-subunit alcohol dehydrogenase family)